MELYNSTVTGYTAFLFKKKKISHLFLSLKIEAR